jgi:hypothetical protein
VQGLVDQDNEPSHVGADVEQQVEQSNQDGQIKRAEEPRIRLYERRDQETCGDDHGPASGVTRGQVIAAGGAC